jgi:hypothetical protein
MKKTVEQKKVDFLAMVTKLDEKKPKSGIKSAMPIPATNIKSDSDINTVGNIALTVILPENKGKIGRTLTSILQTRPMKYTEMLAIWCIANKIDADKAQSGLNGYLHGFKNLAYTKEANVSLSYDKETKKYTVKKLA